MEETAIIIQARTGSSRMPKKVILPFYNDKSIIELLFEKLSKINITAILATTSSPNDDPLEEIANKYPVKVYRGSENNVLDRFIKAAEQYQIKNIIRLCADNPFLSIPSIQKLISEFENKALDYMSFSFQGNKPAILTHFGFYTEITTYETLKKVSEITNDKLYIEHVTNYIYTHPETFNVGFLKADSCIYNRSDIRLTLDTPDDFALQQEIYSELTTQNFNFDIQEIVAYLDKHPQILQRMKSEIEKNSK